MKFVESELQMFVGVQLGHPQGVGSKVKHGKHGNKSEICYFSFTFQK